LDQLAALRQAEILPAARLRAWPGMRLALRLEAEAAESSD